MKPFRFRLILLTLLAVIAVAACNGISGGEPRVRTEMMTVVVVWTATPDPDYTPPVIIITATSDREQVNVPPDIVPTGDGSVDENPATNSTTLPDQTTNVEPVLPENCIIHVVDSGETIFGIATDYDVDGFLVLAVNELSEEEATGLQIGDELIIPLEGCPVDQVAALPTDTPIPSETPDVSPTPTLPVTSTLAATEIVNTPTPTVSPTITLPPTATNAQVEIAGIDSAGDVTAEGVRIVNPGSIIRIDNWTIRDTEGNEYVFGEQILFSNSELTLYTRDGQDTPIARFWGLEQPVWQPGDVVTLLDERNRIQAVYRIPASGE